MVHSAGGAGAGAAAAVVDEVRLALAGWHGVAKAARLGRAELEALEKAGKLDAAAVIDHAALQAAGLARGGKDGVRLLAKGEFSAKASFLVAGVSAGARAAVEKAGGSVELPAAQPSEHEKKTARREANKAAK